MSSPSVTSTFASWNGLDWLLAAIVVISTVRAFLRGMVRALFGLAGLLGGFALASSEDLRVAKWMTGQGWFSSSHLAKVVAYAAIVFGVMLLFGLAGAVVRKTAHAAGLGLADRALGGVVGLVRGMLLGAGIAIAAQAVAPSTALVRGSQLSSYFLAAGHAVSFVVPYTLR